MSAPTHMRLEALEAAATVARMLQNDEATLARLLQQLHDQPPRTIITIARGSSDHAASYFGYLCMMRLGRWVTSLAPSLITLHAAPLQREGVLALAFSQSGQSPDLVSAAAYFSEGGGHSVALVNDAGSALARQSHTVLPLHAGVEHSVAATKSFIAQLAGGARLVARWQGDSALAAALVTLPQALEQAAALEWPQALHALKNADRLMVISRGLGSAVALEASLKFKETCGIQAETFSSAEVRHGPMALIESGYPLLILAPRGPAQGEMVSLAQEMRRRGATVLLAASGDVDGADLRCVPAPHPDLDSICLIQTFYMMVEALSRARGQNPDRPSHLSKVTLTR